MPNSSLDHFDRRILDEVQINGRVTNQDLSDRIGLSPSPCLRRLKQLESDNVITGYVALVDPEAVGLSVTAFVRVRLDQQDDHHLALFEDAVTSFPEVMECYLMTGEADYQLRVLVPSLSAFEDFLRARLTRIKGVAQVTTSFALRPVVYRTALPTTA
ncbi:Lrp/AsnC family leucine-responsive transcriptional regulator [Novosphingobium sp. PhB165]|jgi:Lrp/AsnC family transcriptional regulator, leucine-responsive regulatory protein|uniref:Lrp/AsnC family transcriptional regulator n=1 Tax=Novosphingobium sp. PhB165 TaxID=2485105 RepID=UPI00104DA523|nr:Lrp/AsnC family transcriptional regulator [Novosphingobium sp. PhB165]TCM20884.1 Lrp/AsnC family leucine-responsive transcriptional regulator [Novosphingobium sp. PhB165]